MGRNCGKGGETLSTKSKRKANGCMGAFYHLFDFQNLYSHSHQNLTIDSPPRSKGLKLTQESPPSATYKDKQSLNIPVRMRVRRETGTRSSRLKALATDSSTSSSSEICNSPGSKTPSLVARLMGLDLLPEKTDLNHSLSNIRTMTYHGSSRLTSHPKRGTRLGGGGTRSLPESPRVSSARRSDFDIHRLSLQLNKGEEFGCSRLKLMKQEQDQEEIQSPRQILKQIKERVVTRRAVGMDITNSVKNREARPCDEHRRDTTVSCSPRTRFSNKENKPSTPSSSFRPEQTTHNTKTKPTKVILVSVPKASGEKQSKNRVKQKEVRPIINQCKKKAKSVTRFTQRPLKPSQTPDTRNKAFLSESTTDVKAISNPLHIKKFKRVPKSSDYVDNNISVTRPPLKHDHRVPSPQINELEGIKAKNGPEGARDYHCSVVASCSSNRCPILGEIASVEFDRLLETKKNLEEEEVEEIISEIERGIIETLVRETAHDLILQRRRSETTSERKLSH